MAAKFEVYQDAAGAVSVPAQGRATARSWPPVKATQHRPPPKKAATPSNVPPLLPPLKPSEQPQGHLGSGTRRSPLRQPIRWRPGANLFAVIVEPSFPNDMRNWYTVHQVQFTWPPSIPSPASRPDSTSCGGFREISVRAARSIARSAIATCDDRRPLHHRRRPPHLPPLVDRPRSRCATVWSVKLVGGGWQF
jgi:hypothetical protein